MSASHLLLFIFFRVALKSTWKDGDEMIYICMAAKWQARLNILCCRSAVLVHAGCRGSYLEVCKHQFSRCKSLQEKASHCCWPLSLCPERVKKLTFAVPCHRFVSDRGNMDGDESAPLASFCVKEEADDGFGNSGEGATATWSRGTKRGRDLEGGQKEVRTAYRVLCCALV